LWVTHFLSLLEKYDRYNGTKLLISFKFDWYDSYMDQILDHSNFDKFCSLERIEADENRSENT